MTTAPIAPEKTTVMVQLALEDDWLTVCELSRLTPGRGVAALLPDGRQAAVFLDRSGQVHAVDNTDPFTGASVLSRGLLGSAQGRPFVASPLLKQRFDLETGRCLDDDGVAVRAYPARAINPQHAG
ncbi:MULTISPECIES: nitrite reductase small subunit NirD [unclassified Streptomyces]|uniref:nitrite reductase small subunit NirD n=1 Tax=unclassified Streptomyces TaxID=2593676 RepID=UPI000DB94935|nr:MULTISPECIES: nitrite reductase small subunit NirD [unclassified Streptomyces]MYT73162.1 nitrite reductase small subunit NirD [Streptomyces sp. SID8367]RAJ73623.1 nitrite reductase (NADH) small subunit [Streptomyces sp. PsTaAH-137]